MSQLSATAVFDATATIGPLAQCEVSKNRPDVRVEPIHSEHGIARYLGATETRSASIRSLRSGSRKPTDRSQSSQRFPEAWELLLELLAARPKPEVELQLVELLDCFEAMTRAVKEARSTFRDYVTALQLQSMMTIYLGLDSREPSIAISEALSLAWEAIVLIDLDTALDDELFDLLSEPPVEELEPSAALQSTLNIQLDQIIALFEAASVDSIRPWSFDARRRISVERREGYWSLVKQWLAGSTHLRIPTKLAIGSIRWPKVQEHWLRLSKALQSDGQPTSNIADFVEIRRSNDPQLAAALQAQLERCRDESGSMALAIVKLLSPHPELPSDENHPLANWQRVVIEQLGIATGGCSMRGFIGDENELSVMISDMERGALSAVLREVLEIANQPTELVSKLFEQPKLTLVCGVGCVTGPSKRFQIDQLVATAERCLEAAQKQGPGSVKSLEVF